MTDDQERLLLAVAAWIALQPRKPNWDATELARHRINELAALVRHQRERTEERG